MKLERTRQAINGLLADRRRAGLCTDFALDEIAINVIEDPMHGRFLRVELLFADGSTAGVDSKEPQGLIDALSAGTKH